jgi:hypothetical protein
VIQTLCWITFAFVLFFSPIARAEAPPAIEPLLSSFSLKETLKDLRKKDVDMKPSGLTFLIHFGRWPVAQGSGAGSRLHPAEGFPDKEAKWISFPLEDREIVTKRKAILHYHTRMLVMGRYLLSFARANELFLIDYREWTQKMEKTPCCWE